MEAPPLLLSGALEVTANQRQPTTLGFREQAPGSRVQSSTLQVSRPAQPKAAALLSLTSIAVMQSLVRWRSEVELAGHTPATTKRGRGVICSVHANAMAARASLDTQNLPLYPQSLVLSPHPITIPAPPILLTPPLITIVTMFMSHLFVEVWVLRGGRSTAPSWMS